MRWLWGITDSDCSTADIYSRRRARTDTARLVGMSIREVEGAQREREWLAAMGVIDEEEGEEGEDAQG